MPLENWPQWACDEDGEVYWIRGDIAAKNDLDLLPDLRSMDIVNSIDQAGLWSTVLIFDGKVACWLNLAPWPEWRLHELHDDDPADDAVVYWSYSAETADYVAPDQLVFGAAS